MKNESALDIRTKADQLLELTQAMLATAKSDDWDTFELQERQRRSMLEMFFDNQADVESAKLALVDVIKEIQLIDKTIINLASQQRDQAAKELRHLKYAREGNKAYQIAADDSL